MQKYKAFMEDDTIALNFIEFIFMKKRTRRCKQIDKKLKNDVKRDLELGIKIKDIQNRYKISTYTLYKILEV